MKKPTEAEYRLISQAAMERLGEDGARLLLACFDMAHEHNWPIRELLGHIEGAGDVVRGLIDGWVDEGHGG